VIAGLPTSIPLLQAIGKDPAFAAGDYHIDWLAGFLKDWQAAS
jgi:biotin carboxylase